MMSDDQGGAPAGTPGFHGQIVLNVIAGNRASFLCPYALLLALLAPCLALMLVAALAGAWALASGEARADDIAAFFKEIAAFRFGALGDIPGSHTASLTVAAALAAEIALLVLALALGVAFRILKGRKTVRTAVSPLLPGRKRGFVPCAEGIYKAFYHNLLSGNSYYSLYPWETLSLCAVRERKKRVVLMDRRRLMPLIARGGLFDELKAVVLERLPEDRRVSAWKARYRWGVAAVAALVAIALMFTCALWLESASGKGNAQCDVGGAIHWSFRPAFATSGYALKVFDGRSRVVHTYCELHGVLYEILHPAAHLRSIGRLIGEGEFAQILQDPIFVFDMLVFPGAAWVYLLIAVVLIGKPRAQRFNAL